LNIAEQVCEGLVAIHKINIFHRDIKPENILITRADNTAMIMDLGVSRILNPSELASTTVGTIYYMPKELLKSQGGSFYSDIYSLGVTMYEMATGDLPFIGASFEEIMDNILRKPPIPPIAINPKIDEKLNKVILKAMSREIDDRYKTAEDMLRAIKAYRRGVDEDDELISIEAAKAQELFSAGKVREAEQCYIALTKQYPKNPRSYLALGEFYNRCYKHDEALSVFKNGIKCAPNFALLYRDMAISQIAAKKGKEAIENLKKAIALGLEPDQAKHCERLLKTIER
jgi:serine/threonine protein kinase